MITLSQGDTAILNLTITDGDGNPLDITGAVLTTEILGSSGVIVYDSAHHTIKNQTTDPGEFLLTLSAIETAAIQRGVGKDIVTKMVLAGQTIYFHGNGILTVLANIPMV